MITCEDDVDDEDDDATYMTMKTFCDDVDAM
jgi:hypothetical protein